MTTLSHTGLQNYTISASNEFAKQRLCMRQRALPFSLSHRQIVDWGPLVLLPTVVHRGEISCIIITALDILLE